MSKQITFCLRIIVQFGVSAYTLVKVLNVFYSPDLNIENVAGTRPYEMFKCEHRTLKGYLKQIVNLSPT